MKESLQEPMNDAARSSMQIFENILHDRSLHQEIDHPALTLARHEYALLMQDLEPGAQNNIAENISLLSHLNGHRGSMLRNIATHPTQTPEGAHIAQLYRWSRETVQREKAPDFNELLHKAPLSTENPETTYELVSFLEKNPEVTRDDLNQSRTHAIADILEMPPGNYKWTDLVDPLTTALVDETFLQRYLTTIGSVPTEIYTKKAFKNIPPERLVKALETMRAQEASDGTGASDYERAKLLNYFISSKNANALRTRGKKAASMDANGIFINLKGFHAHLPYGLCLPQTVNALVSDRWLSEEEGSELQARSAEESSEQASYEKAREIQEVQFRSLHEGLLDAPLEEAIIQDPDSVAALCLKGAILPDSIIDSMRDSASPETLFALMQLGEILSQKITDEVVRRDEAYATKPYQALHAAERAYEVRSGVMNRPEYYTVTKIAKRLLQKPLPYTKETTGYLRGAYKVREGDQHAFFEMLHDGRVARILLNEPKHLRPIEKKHFEELPLYGKEDYLEAERAVGAFERFSDASKAIRTAIILDSNTVNNIEICLDFLLTSVTTFYDDAAHCHSSLTSASAFEQHDLLIAFVDICDKAGQEYKSFLYRHLQHPEHFRERLAPEVKKHDVHFGGSTHEDIKEHTCPDGSDETLCRESQPIRIVTLHYKSEDPTATIPLHVEESTLDALRINRDRPLINVIGGCKNLGTSKVAGDPLELMSTSVLQVAHEQKANVAVPGTQSGIGITFGRANVIYRAQHGHLPHNDQAHVFAISPGGSTYFPGNPFIEPGADTAHTYAVTTVDSILTPFPAGWGARGAEKFHTPYIHHVAYMESLYQRIAAGQKKIIVVGNGGFYSLLEINDSIRRGFEVILIKDSGRFAELAAHMVERPSVLEAFAESSLGDSNLLHLIRTSMPELSAHELCEKDFGYRETPENEDYQVYRDTLRIFARIIKNNSEQITVTSLATLEETLRDQMKA